MLAQPAAVCGFQKVRFAMKAVWSDGAGALAGQTVSDATFQVQLPGRADWIPACSTGAGASGDTTCNGTCNGEYCSYEYTVPTTNAAQYIIQFQAVLSGMCVACVCVHR